MAAGLHARAGVAAEDAVDLGGRAGPLALHRREALLADVGLGRGTDLGEFLRLTEREFLPGVALAGRERAYGVVETGDRDAAVGDIGLPKISIVPS